MPRFHIDPAGLFASLPLDEIRVVVLGVVVGGGEGGWGSWWWRW